MKERLTVEKGDGVCADMSLSEPDDVVNIRPSRARLGVSGAMWRGESIVAESTGGGGSGAVVWLKPADIESANAERGEVANGGGLRR